MTAVLLSALLCPGAGQIVKGQRLKGGLMALVSLVLTAWLVVVVARDLLSALPADPAGVDFLEMTAELLATVARDTLMLLSVLGLLLVVWAYSVVDAYRG